MGSKCKYRWTRSIYRYQLPAPPAAVTSDSDHINFRATEKEGNSIITQVGGRRAADGGAGFLWQIHMAEPAGLLKVVVVQGKSLVVRDFRSSDPYVVVKIGNQIAKTKVINSCLNPVWNEELTFTLSSPVEVLNLEVFDKDRFKADDKMGHAHLSLQPIVSAARLQQILRVSSGETTLRKVIPGSDNCLVAESSIISISGEVVQNVWLRLCEVESGDIELRLKLINYPPIARSDST